MQIRFKTRNACVRVLCSGFDFHHRVADYLTLYTVAFLKNGCYCSAFGIAVIFITHDCIMHIRIKDAFGFYFLKSALFEAVEKLFAKLNMKTGQISEGPTAFFIKDYKKMAEEIGVGEITLRDIIKELQKPGRDPRDEMPRPILRTDVLDMKDLKVGMILKGTVRNVIDFGAFVDIGVHQDGLVHISQMTKRFIKHPLEAVSVGDIVEVKVISLDLAKKRIGLSMLLDK